MKDMPVAPVSPVKPVAPVGPAVSEMLSVALWWQLCYILKRKCEYGPDTVCNLQMHHCRMRQHIGLAGHTCRACVSNESRGSN